MITLDDVKLFNLRNFIEPDGNLVPIESKHDIPFDMKRIFYVYGVDNQDDRGKHSHYKTKQVLICLNGEVKVVCDDGKNRQSYTLSKPNQALYIPEMIWDEQVYISEDSVLLVLANTHYDTSDYIEDYNKFVKLKEKEWK
tara:strand:- start:1832 stop:2251 length:420 start_codon:yes stop_codon:yes gene_type:complete